MARANIKKRELPVPSPEQVLALGLSEAEWAQIAQGLGRPANELEASIFAVLWGEACSRKSTRSLFERVSAALSAAKAGESWARAAVVDIGDGMRLAVSIEQTNAETSQDSLFGAELCLSKALEGLLSVGARPLGFASLVRAGDAESAKNNERLVRLTEGLSRAANLFGIPSISGDLFFNKAFDLNMLLNVCAVGVLPSAKAGEVKALPPRSPVVYFGNSTGYDGLTRAGLTALADPKVVSEGGKQSEWRIANLFFQQRLSAACLSAIEKGLLSCYVVLDDGGLATGLVQLAAQVGSGITAYLDNVPCVNDNFRYLERVLSQTPQRIVAAVTKENHRELSDLLATWGIKLSTLGEVVDSDDVELIWHHHEVGIIPYRHALESVISREYNLIPSPPMLKSAISNKAEAAKVPAPPYKVPSSIEDVWIDMLADVNLCARKLVIAPFDFLAGANTIIPPGGDGTLIRLCKDGVSTARGLALSIDSNSLYLKADAYLGAVQSVADGVRNVSATGARPVAVCHCLNFGDLANFQEVSALSETIRGISDACSEWKLPIVEQSVSVGNGSAHHQILSTPTIAVIGVLDDISKATSSAFQSSGDAVLVLGQTKKELGCSEYANYCHKVIEGNVPEIDFAGEARVCGLVRDLIAERLLSSAHDVSIGGLATALVECSVGGEKSIGATLALEPVIGEGETRADTFLFSETSGRFIVSCPAEHVETVRARAETAGVKLGARGQVGGKQIKLEGVVDYSIAVNTAARIWNGGLNHVFQVTGN